MQKRREYLHENPFAVLTPEDIPAELAHELWVDVFTDFRKLRNTGHCLLRGPRGSGKSMMFRYLLPDCQSLEHELPLQDLPFFAILVPIKNCHLNLADLDWIRTTNRGLLLNEHLLTMFSATRVFAALRTQFLSGWSPSRREIVALWGEEFLPRLQTNGWRPTQSEAKAPRNAGPAKFIARMQQICDRLYQEVIAYVRRSAWEQEEESPAKYTGPLCGYMDFLYPVISRITSLQGMPDGPAFLLIDDADNLNEIQTKVLNTWLSTRTSKQVSMKVSTQPRYKTYTTLQGTRVSAPHDFSEIDISEVYTRTRSTYRNRVEQIVKNRLRFAGCHDISPQAFFPCDEQQEAAIAKEAELIRKSYSKSGRGFRVSDDVLRYARPEFIRKLSGKRKALATYSYAGFDQLVDVSSTLVRDFLEPAANMYAEVASRPAVSAVTAIPASIQNRIVRDRADELMFTEFDKIFQEEKLKRGVDAATALMSMKHRLHNLIRVLGVMFRIKLHSRDSERRVFSVALSGVCPGDLEALFELGVELGYFQKSFIGNKTGTGRTPMYILTRRLAPHFGLDPSGFSGYLFVRGDSLLDGVRAPDSYLRAFGAQARTRGWRDACAIRQLHLFPQDE